jgi:4-hydroxy-2-oxoglutarate aldolase
MSPGALRDHYRAVADAAPVPVILYQVPLRFSTVELATGVVAELSEHPNVVGVKDSRGDLALVGALVEATRAGFQVLVGNGAKLYGSLEVGAVGGILGVANLVPGETAAIVRAVADGRGAEAGRLQERVGPLHTGIVGSFGVPGVKLALDFMGLRGGPPRPPLSPLGDRERTEVRELLDAAGILGRQGAAGPQPFRNREPAGGR